MNKFHPPKQLVLTEWLARPAQPVAAAYPVLRDNGVAAYNWALIIVDCTSHWNRPIVPGDPPFQAGHTHSRSSPSTLSRALSLTPGYVVAEWQRL